MSHKYVEISLQWVAIVGAVDSTALNTPSKSEVGPNCWMPESGEVRSWGAVIGYVKRLSY